MNALIIVGFILYILPTIIAFGKNTYQKEGVLLTNIFFGWIPFIWLLLFICTLFYWPTVEERNAMIEREQLAIDADKAVVAMEERSRKALM